MSIEDKKNNIRFHKQLYAAGTMDYDVKGKIFYYCESAPKNYIFYYTTPDGKIKRHVRTKGFDRRDQKHLLKPHFDMMLSRHAPWFTKNIDFTDSFKTYDGFGVERGALDIRDGIITQTVNEKFTKTGARTKHIRNENGEITESYSDSNILMLKLVKAINTTGWKKREFIYDSVEHSSIAFGSNYATLNNYSREYHDYVFNKETRRVEVKILTKEEYDKIYDNKEKEKYRTVLKKMYYDPDMQSPESNDLYFIKKEKKIKLMISDNDIKEFAKNISWD